MPNLPCLSRCRQRLKASEYESTGARATFFYPNGGHYKGYWSHNQQHQYGVKESVQNLTYDGQWQYGNRHGCGTMRRRLANGTSERIFIGQYRHDKKWGEGKQYFPDGTYYGWWANNRRHGLGIMWYNDGRLYLGEWRVDVYHGMGVLFYANGNRYEGNYARGYKNGEGTFYHMHTGQIQKGVWDSDNCVSSMVIDEFRGQVDQPTKYPIPKCTLVEPDEFIHRIFQKHFYNSYRRWKSFNELACLCFVKKYRRYTKFEPKATSNSQFDFDLVFPCPCSKPERLILLREL